MSRFDESGRPLYWFRPHLPQDWPVIFYPQGQLQLTRESTMQLLKLCADALADTTRKENG